MEANKNTRLDELFNQAKNEAPKVSYEETKQQFLSSIGKMNVSSNGIKQVLSLKNIMIMVATICTIAIGTIVLVNNLLEPTNTMVLAKKELKTDSILILEEHEKVMTEYLKKIESIKPDLYEKTSKSKKLIEIKKSSKIQLDTLKKAKNIAINKSKSLAEDSSYSFPKLTPEEIKSNNKQKYEMLRGLARYNRMPALNNIDIRKYPMVYWNKPVKNGKVTSIDVTGAFHIQKTEVSNLEYRTFLFDLLLQGKKEEFLIAKPNQKVWINDFNVSYNQPMVDNYFSHLAYNDYPVVGVSREGAELYCKWLTEERNKLNVAKYGVLANKVRLPTDKEWIQAASDGGKHLPYPWGGPYLRNSNGSFLAN